MPRWLLVALARILDLARQDKVRFTLKALRELATLGLDADDGIAVIARLSASDCRGRVLSERTGEWLYVFKPRVAGEVLYLKLAVRQDCIVVSFHEDDGDGHEDEDT
jgi:hypothetical protein